MGFNDDRGDNPLSNQPPISTRDLLPKERRFLRAMQELGHGRFECLRIFQGELVLDPWPATIRSVKFGNATPNRPLLGQQIRFHLRALAQNP